MSAEVAEFVQPPEDSGVKDFTRPRRPPIEFIIDSDTFWAVADAPGGSITDLAQVVNAKDETEKLRSIMEFFDQALLAESADLFADRLRDPNNPITFPQAVDVFEYLVSKYTDDVRPTKAPPSSQSGSGPTLPSSTGPRRSGARRTTARRVSPES